MEKWTNIGGAEIELGYYYYLECTVDQNNQLEMILYGEGSDELLKIKIEFGTVLYYSAIKEGWDNTDSYYEQGLAINRPEFSEGVLFEVENGEVGDTVLSTCPEQPIYHYCVYGINYIVDIISMNRPRITKL